MQQRKTSFGFCITLGCLRHLRRSTSSVILDAGAHDAIVCGLVRLSSKHIYTLSTSLDGHFWRQFPFPVPCTRPADPRGLSITHAACGVALASMIQNYVTFLDSHVGDRCHTNVQRNDYRKTLHLHLLCIWVHSVPACCSNSRLASHCVGGHRDQKLQPPCLVIFKLLAAYYCVRSVN